MMLIWLLACAPNATLEADLLELQATHAELRDNLDELQHELATLQQQAKREARARARGDESTEPAVCTPRDDGSYTLPPTLDAGLLEREARGLLHRNEAGAYDGYRLSAIRRGHLLDSCGVKNGDTIHQVNEIELTSSDAVLSAYEAYRSGLQLTVELTRRTKAVVLVLHPNE